MNEARYYRYDDINKFFGISSESIARLVAEGKLTNVKLEDKNVIERDKFHLLHPSDLITTQEENNFLSRILGSNFTQDREQFLRLHYSVITSITKQYDNRNTHMDEINRIAISSMDIALSKYKPNQKERFSLYASKWIRYDLEKKFITHEKQKNSNGAPPFKKQSQTKPVQTAANTQTASNQQCSDNINTAIEKLRAIKDRSPLQLYEALQNMGYVGQEEACKKLCLMAYRHIRRLKDFYLKKIPLNNLPPKGNVLMVGPTGCGKTYLTKLLFENIIGVPVTTIDITGFTEVGYVGRNVSEVLLDLHNAAGGNTSWAKMGICILDEFDKIASSCSNTGHSGGGTSKDVSGYGVQRQLLKMIEGGRHEISSGNIYKAHSGIYMDTDCVGFVACGAFSGIKELAQRHTSPSFGFNVSEDQHVSESSDYGLEKNKSRSIETFSEYGFMPELLGRFNSIMTLSPLDASTLTSILKNNVLPSYEQEFNREGLDLSLPEAVFDNIVTNAVSRKTGARGLIAELTEYIEEQAIKSFGANL